MTRVNQIPGANFYFYKEQTRMVHRTGLSGETPGDIQFVDVGARIYSTNCLETSSLYPVESKLKHLEFIQAVISRMAGNSFLLKGWCVTLVAALFGLAANEATPYLMVLVYYVVLVFWLIDTYFLWQEKLFRKLYELVCSKKNEHINFSMDTSEAKKEVCLVSAIFSGPSLGFYLAMAVAVLLMGHAKGLSVGH